MNQVDTRDTRTDDEILEQVRAEMAAERRTILLDVDADKVASLIPFTKRPEGNLKWAMNSICFQPAPTGGLLIVATDGHSALARHDPNGLMSTPEGKELLLSPYAGNTKTLHPVFGGLLTSQPRSAVRLIIRDGQISQEDGRPGNYDIAPLLVTDGTFPKWQNILASFKNAKLYQGHCSFDATLLARFDCFPKRKTPQAHGVVLWQVEPSESSSVRNPIFVTSPYPDSADFIGVFMPLDFERQKDALDLVVPPRRWFIDALAEHQNNVNAATNGNGHHPPQSTPPSQAAPSESSISP